MLGILISVVCFLYRTPTRHRRYAYTFLGIYIAITATLSLSNASLWGDTVRAATVWVEEHPDSIRARLFAGKILYPLASREAKQAAQRHVNYLYKNRGDSATSILTLLYFAVPDKHDYPVRVNEALKKLKQASYYGHLSEALTSLETYAYDEKCPESLNIQSFHRLLNRIKEAPGFKHTDLWNRHHIHRMESRIFVSRGNLQKTMDSLEQAYTYKPTLDIRLLQASYLISARLYQEATIILDDIPKTFSRLNVKLHIDTINAFGEMIQKNQQRKTNQPRINRM